METTRLNGSSALKNELAESMMLNGMIESDAHNLVEHIDLAAKPKELKCYLVTLTCIYCMLPCMPETREFSMIRKRLSQSYMGAKLPKINTLMNMLDRINEHTLAIKRKETEALNEMTWRRVSKRKLNFRGITGKALVIQPNPGMIN